MSPRVVNRHFDRDSKEELLESDGYKFDQKHADTLWRNANRDEKKKTVSDISAIPYAGTYWYERPWEWKYRNEVWQDPDTDDLDEEWGISEKRWHRLTAMINSLNERGIQVLLYLSLFHPIMRGKPVVDDDGTTQKGCRELVDRLRKLKKHYSNLVFVDLIQGGNHDFGPELFKDLDHMNAVGAARLTYELEKIRQRHAKKHRK